MILEGVVTTLDADGTVHIAPMGPRVSADGRRLFLRPFKSSHTYRNLKERREGVFHVTDDVELIARAAVGKVEAPVVPAKAIQGQRLKHACRAQEFRVRAIDDREQRVLIEADIVLGETLRDFYGFNRAKHAVLEAAILATRLHLLPATIVQRKIEELGVLVEKTGGEAEHRALDFLRAYVAGPSAAAGRPQAAAFVRTGSRLHLGLIVPSGASPRRFGGAGLMIQDPGMTLIAREAAQPHARNALEERALEFARQFLQADSSPYEFEIRGTVESHQGLGTGTQLALAVASAIAFLGGDEVAATEAAEKLGRGTRSAIGVHGFAQGGFLADGGLADTTARSPHGNNTRIAPLLFRGTIPEAWRFLIVTPDSSPGLSGRAEQHAFSEIPLAPQESVTRLCSLLWLGILPSLKEGDFGAFSEALYDYGVLAGELFASVQAGPFASRGVAGLVEQIRARGTRGVGQSSWGPTVYAVLEDDESAQHLRDRLHRECGVAEHDMIVSAPLNRGATVGLPPDLPSMETLA